MKVSVQKERTQFENYSSLNREYTKMAGLSLQSLPLVSTINDAAFPAFSTISHIGYVLWSFAKPLNYNNKFRASPILSIDISCLEHIFETNLNEYVYAHLEQIF